MRWMKRANVRLRIYHKVVTLIGKGGYAPTQIQHTGDYVNYLGIDIGKNNHAACLLGENGKIPICRMLLTEAGNA